MSDFDQETYKVNRRTGTVHIAIGGRVMERCNTDDAKALSEVMSIEDIGAVTKRKPKFCRWCARDMVL